MRESALNEAVIMLTADAYGDPADRPVLLAVVLIAALIGVWVVARIPTRQSA